VTFRDILAGEVRKALTLRPLLWATVISTAVMLAFAIIDSNGQRERILNPTGNVVEGLTAVGSGLYSFFYFAFLPILIAVLVTASEYAGGQLTTSILAAPRRGTVLAAKVVTVTAATIVLGILQSGMILACYQERLGDISVFATGAAGEYLGLLGMGILFWITLAIISMAAAVIFRQQTAVLAVMISLAFLSTPLLMINTAIFQFLPANSGTLMFMADDAADIAATPADLMSVPAATTVTVLWAVAAILAAAVVFARRDIGARQAVTE
jgi:hypothetical protein